ncbi:MAG: hypothetical protein Q4C65_06790 [Eubacteriales bacterium]|nr:hypothetical protein [Eubacteriales bacterium]
MKNNELIPFERNRYYTGKMLTSADFEAEQSYLNNKRRFLNQMVTGAGIVCGLSVVSLDDQSLMIESGMAIDDTGREIVVDSSVVKKLSALAGFEELTSDHVSLCLKYREEPVHAVYAVNRQDGEKEYEYNRIREEYELFVKDTAELAGSYEADTEFYTGGRLFENQDYVIRLRMPAVVCAGHYVKLEVEAEKLSDRSVKLYYEGVLQTPALSAPGGEQELKLFLDNIQLPKGKRTVREYWLLAQEEELEDTGVLLRPGSGRAVVGGVETPADFELGCRVSVSRRAPEELALAESGKVSMELRNMGRRSDYIRLADLDLVRTEAAYLIEKVTEAGRAVYLPTMREERQRREFEGFFSRRLPFYERKGKGERLQDGGAVRAAEEGRLPRIGTGIVEIPLGGNARRGDICYSGEITHGLGKGNVYVEVGYEYLEEDPALKQDTRVTVYGNPELFPSAQMLQVSAEAAVKVQNDKGSFVVAVRLLQDVDYLTLTYRWVAVRYDGQEEDRGVEYASSRSISAVTPTVVLGTKESYYFQVKFNNMKKCSLFYEMTEPDSGEVTADGVYTAPAREGVYEIRIYCADMPLICTYAYAIVKKKTMEEEAG